MEEEKDEEDGDGIGMCHVAVNVGYQHRIERDSS
jgi:hypothetical protein